MIDIFGNLDGIYAFVTRFGYLTPRSTPNKCIHWGICLTDKCVVSLIEVRSCNDRGVRALFLVLFIFADMFHFNTVEKYIRRNRKPA